MLAVYTNIDCFRTIECSYFGRLIGSETADIYALCCVSIAIHVRRRIRSLCHAQRPPRLPQHPNAPPPLKVPNARMGGDKATVEKHCATRFFWRFWSSCVFILMTAMSALPSVSFCSIIELQPTHPRNGKMCVDWLYIMFNLCIRICRRFTMACDPC